MAARPRTLPAAIAPVLVGTAAAIEVPGNCRGWAPSSPPDRQHLHPDRHQPRQRLLRREAGADTVDRLGPVRVTAAGLVAPRVSSPPPGSPSGSRSRARHLPGHRGGGGDFNRGRGRLDPRQGPLHRPGRDRTATPGWASFSSSSSSAWSPSTAPTTSSWRSSTGSPSASRSRSAAWPRRSSWSTTSATSKPTAAPASGPWRSGSGATRPGASTSPWSESPT